MSLFVEVALLAPMRPPIEIVTQGDALMGQVGTQGLGKFFKKPSLILFRRFDLGAIGKVSDAFVGIEALQEKITSLRVEE